VASFGSRTKVPASEGDATEITTLPLLRQRALTFDEVSCTKATQSGQEGGRLISPEQIALRAAAIALDA
jgi:hypothetical protein